MDEKVLMTKLKRGGTRLGSLRVGAGLGQPKGHREFPGVAQPSS